MNSKRLSNSQKYQIVRDDYNGISNWYDTELNGAAEFAAQLQDFTAILPSHAKVLDAGAGTGEESNVLSKSGSEVTALDLSPNMLATLHRKYPQIKTQEGNLIDQIFTKEEFDAIWCARAIIHIPPEDLPKAIKQFCRIIKSKGTLAIIFAVSPKNTILEQLIPEPEAPNTKDLFYYRCLYTPSHITNQLEKIGFQILKQVFFIDKLGKGEKNIYLRAGKMI